MPEASGPPFWQSHPFAQGQKTLRSAYLQVSAPAAPER